MTWIPDWLRDIYFLVPGWDRINSPGCGKSREELGISGTPPACRPCWPPPLPLYTPKDRTHYVLCIVVVLGCIYRGGNLKYIVHYHALSPWVRVMLPLYRGRGRGKTDDSSYAVRSTQKISKTLLINYNPLMKNYIFKRHQPCIATSDIENPDDAPDRGCRKCVITRETRVEWTKPNVEPVGWHTHRYRSHTHIHPSNSSIVHYLPRNKHQINSKIVHTIIIHVNTTELKVKLLNHSENDTLLKFDDIFQHTECHASGTQIKPQAEGTRNAETEVEARLGGRRAPQRI